MDIEYPSHSLPDKVEMDYFPAPCLVVQTLPPIQTGDLPQLMQILNMIGVCITLEVVTWSEACPDVRVEKRKKKCPFLVQSE